jgi:hypothetical protein
MLYRLVIVPQVRHGDMPKNVFACERCNAFFLYADSLRRHSKVQHAKTLSIDATGHIKEYEISDYEREREEIRHRQAKGPYPKRPSQATQDPTPRYTHPKSPLLLNPFLRYCR